MSKYIRAENGEYTSQATRKQVSGVQITISDLTFKWLRKLTKGRYKYLTEPAISVNAIYPRLYGVQLKEVHAIVKSSLTRHFKKLTNTRHKITTADFRYNENPQPIKRLKNARAKIAFTIAKTRGTWGFFLLSLHDLISTDTNSQERKFRSIFNWRRFLTQLAYTDRETDWHSIGTILNFHSNKRTKS